MLKDALVCTPQTFSESKEQFSNAVDSLVRVAQSSGDLRDDVTTRDILRMAHGHRGDLTRDSGRAGADAHRHVRWAASDKTRCPLERSRIDRPLELIHPLCQPDAQNGLPCRQRCDRPSDTGCFAELLALRIQRDCWGPGESALSALKTGVDLFGGRWLGWYPSQRENGPDEPERAYW